MTYFFFSLSLCLFCPATKKLLCTYIVILPGQLALHLPKKSPSARAKTSARELITQYHNRSRYPASLALAPGACAPCLNQDTYQTRHSINQSISPPLSTANRLHKKSPPVARSAITRRSKQKREIASGFVGHQSLLGLNAQQHHPGGPPPPPWPRPRTPLVH